MFRFSIPSLIKFLIGIFLLQAITVLLVYTAEQTDIAETWWLFLSIGAAIGTLVALWFTSLAEGHRHKAESHLKDRHYREREALRAKAEKERVAAMKATERLVAKAKTRAANSNLLKTGALVTGGVGVALLMMTQFVTVGLLAVTTAGGLMLGYGVRARQDRWGRERLIGGEEKRIAAVTYRPEKTGGRLPKPRSEDRNRGQLVDGQEDAGEPASP